MVSSEAKIWKQSHLDYLDILKGLAIIGIVMVHFKNGTPAPNMIFSRIAGIGFLAPQLFFIISAFLLVRSGLKYDFCQVKDWWRFYKSKAIRLLPLYFVSIVVFALLNEEVNACSVLTHLFLINGFIPRFINDIMGVEWYIADLVILYLITPPPIKIR